MDNLYRVHKFCYAKQMEYCKLSGMDFLDDLPERHQSHDTAEAAESAFTAAIVTSRLFEIQTKDRNDYGTDVQIEARDGSGMTNLRVHVQLKGTEVACNPDNTISIQVNRTNLNYLLAQPDSLYVCFHLPSARLLARYANDVYREYEHRGTSWREQNTVTIRFADDLTERFQRRMHARLIAYGRSGRDHRLEWSTTPPSRIPSLVLKSVTPVELPADASHAMAILKELYLAGEDAVISASFARFSAVLDSVNGAMDFAYLAEINLGMNGSAFEKARVRRGIEILDQALVRGDAHPASILYCQGNASLALGEYEDAKEKYLAAIARLDGKKLDGLAAQCFKNLGSACEALHDDTCAIGYYETALKLDPDLGEAHFTLALHFGRMGTDFDRALAHLDAVVHRDTSAISMSSVQGWRIQFLFQNADTSGAFRESKISCRPRINSAGCGRSVQGK